MIKTTLVNLKKAQYHFQILIQEQSMNAKITGKQHYMQNGKKSKQQIKKVQVTQQKIQKQEYTVEV